MMTPVAEVTLRGTPEQAAAWNDAHVDVIVHGADGSATLIHHVTVHVEAGDSASDPRQPEFPPQPEDSSPASRGRGLPAQQDESGSGGAAAPAVFHRAIVSMDSTSPDAEELFRSAIVALDGIPGSEIEGISPLYHVSHVDGPDAMAAVVQLTTTLGARQLIATLGVIEAAHADQIDLDLVDMPGVIADEPDCRVPWPSARDHAGVLAPWLDMDPDARLGRDPVAFLLAMAPDAGQVGMLSDHWVLGGTA